jgi:hypothetical protein
LLLYSLTHSERLASQKSFYRAMGIPGQRMGFIVEWATRSLASYHDVSFFDPFSNHHHISIIVGNYPRQTLPPFNQIVLVEGTRTRGDELHSRGVVF